MSHTDTVRFSSRDSQKTVLGTFDLLLREENLVDVTLAAEGKFLRAHRLVLCAYSDYFKELLTIQPDKHPILLLRDVPYSHVEALIAFMYRGEAEISQNELLGFMQTADSMRIRGLCESCLPLEVCTELGNQPAETSPTQQSDPLELLSSTQEIATTTPVLSKSSTLRSISLRTKSLDNAFREASCKSSVQEKRIPVLRLHPVDAATTTTHQKSAAPPRPNSVAQPTLHVITGVESINGMSLSDEYMDVSTITEIKEEDGKDAGEQEISEGNVILESPEANNPAVLESFEGTRGKPPNEQRIKKGRRGTRMKGKLECSSSARYTCPLCSRSYKYKANLRQHRKLECNVEPQFSCHMCDYKAKRKHHLKEHLKNLHNRVV